MRACVRGRAGIRPFTLKGYYVIARTASPRSKRIEFFHGVWPRRSAVAGTKENYTA